MHDNNGLIWEVDSGIGLRNRGIAPVVYLAEEYAREHIRRELDVLIEARNIVGGNDSAEDGRDVEDLDLCLAKLLIAHGAIAGAELDGLGEYLADAAAAADRLVIDLNI